MIIMFKKELVIRVQSEMNPWINFCIAINNPKDLNQVYDFCQNLYNNWFNIDTSETLTDYIKRNLKEKNFDCVIYIESTDEDYNE